MLRLIVLLLLVANTTYFAWANGLLRAWGLGPTMQSEPQRVAQQVRPESLRILATAEYSKVEEQAKADLVPKECLQAGDFDAAQAATLRKALESGLPNGSWQLDSQRIAARWIVYMGKYPNAEALAKKRAELTPMGLKPESLNNAELEPGMSLGGFDTKKGADDHLAALTQRGIRTARVVQEREEGQAYRLKIPAVTDALKPQIEAVKPALAGKTLKACG